MPAVWRWRWTRGSGANAEYRAGGGGVETERCAPQWVQKRDPGTRGLEQLGQSIAKPPRTGAVRILRRSEAAGSARVRGDGMVGAGGLIAVPTDAAGWGRASYRQE